MKKNIINNKNLTLIAFLLLIATGCAHKNIVKDARFDRLVLRDIKTGKERIYDCADEPAMQNVLMWVAPGDTIALKSGNYAKGRVFTPQGSYLSCDYIELQQRKDKFERDQIRRAVQTEFAKQKSR